MRISDLISIGQRYLSLGVIAAVIILPIFVIIYKKFLKDKYRLTPWKCIWIGTTICYFIVVLGATLMNRAGFWQNRGIMPLFYSYKDAWVDFSVTSWRNIILNICMFLPFGILLPMGIKFFRSFWKISLAGFLFTLFIETSQLLMGRGMFELDDLMDNTVGTMIGYGLYVLAMYLLNAIRKRENNKSLGRVLVLQVPLFLTIATFSTIFISYYQQELGNVGGQYLVKYDTDKLQVSTIESYNKDNKMMSVYKSPSMSKEDTIKFASNFFENLGTTIDESRNDFYEDTAVFWAMDSYSLWIDYAGGNYSMTDFDTSFSEEAIGVVTDATEEEIRETLLKYSIEVPEAAFFEVLEDGDYQFWVEQMIKGNQMIDGYISCTYNENGCMSHINYDLLTCELYKEFEIISEQEAYDMICEGEFRYTGSGELVIEVGECSIQYITDSKGYYQPVYVFACTINGEESQIRIAAI